MTTVRIDSKPSNPPTHNPAQDRDAGWAAGAHLLALLFSFVAAIIINVVVGSHNQFVRQHARQAINFQLNLGVGMFVAILSTALAPGFALLVPLVGLAGLVLPIIAAVRAGRGDWNPYPPLIPFLRSISTPA